MKKDTFRIKRGLAKCAVSPSIAGLLPFLFLACMSGQPSPAVTSSVPAADHFRRSMELATDRRFEAAVEEIDSAIALEPENAEFHMIRGSYLGELGNRTAVLEGLEKALELDPSNLRYFNNRAAYYMKEGQYEAARMDIEKVLAGGEDRLVYAAKDTLAWIYLEQKEFSLALEVLDDIERNHGIQPWGLRYLILLETEGEKAARAYGRSILPRLEKKEGFSAEHTIRLLMGEMDLRDVKVQHIYELSAYRDSLKKASEILNNLAAARPPAYTGVDNPVLMLRPLQPIGVEEQVAIILSGTLRSGMTENGRYRIVDDKARKIALEELKAALSGLTEGETDVQLGRFLSADYILAGSVSMLEGEYFCNIIVSHTETAQILYSKFLFAENLKDLNIMLVRTANSISL